MSLTIVSPLTEEDIKFINFAVELLENGKYPSFDKVTDTHNRLLGKNLKKTHCAKCIRDRVSQLKNIVDENERGNVVVVEAKPVEEKPKKEKEKTKKKRVVKKIAIENEQPEQPKTEEQPVMEAKALNAKISVMSIPEPTSEEDGECKLKKYICVVGNEGTCEKNVYGWTYLVDCNLIDNDTIDKNLNVWTINGFTYKPVDFFNATEGKYEEYEGETVKYLNNFAENNNTLLSVNMNNFDTGNVISWAYAFSRCTKLQSVILPSGLCEPNSPEILAGMFCGCYNLKYVNLGNMTPDNIKNANNMFKNCNEKLTVICNNGSMKDWIKENYSLIGLNNIPYFEMATV